MYTPNILLAGLTSNRETVQVSYKTAQETARKWL